MAIATAVAARTLLALTAAHAADIIHCDVRPANMVMVQGRAVLVDWGSAVDKGGSGHCHGVPSFSDSRVFDAGSYKARPEQDALGLLYSWLAIAFDGGCCAPWGLWPRRAAGQGAEVSVKELRVAWIKRQALLHREVGIVEEAIGRLSVLRVGALEEVEAALQKLRLLHSA